MDFNIDSIVQRIPPAKISHRYYTKERTDHYCHCQLIRSSIRNHKYSLTVKKALTRGVKQFYNGDSHNPIEKTPYTNIITCQQQIGWNQFVRRQTNYGLIETITDHYHKENKNTLS